jgi:NAD(P)-dependent dehydrogenase (short-subunit alcohol dehydrogenase family)
MTNWFITGISRGLGKALAQAALARGDTVVGTMRGDTTGIEFPQDKLHVLNLEIGDLRDIERAVTEAFERVGRIDVLVNNAGYGLLGPIEFVTDAELAKLFEVNVFGPFRLIRSVLPRLRAQNGGHIVNITSIAGRAPMAGSGAYAAAKSAMEGLSSALLQEVGPLGIKVTAVAPGAFRTDFLSDHSIRRSDPLSDAYAASVGPALDGLDKHAGKQIGDPTRAAEAILAAVDAPEPPLHLLLGPDALRRTREKLDAVIDEMDRWEDVTSSTNFAQ